MDYKSLYSETIIETNLILSDYKASIINGEIGHLDSLKARLVANKAILRQIYHDGHAYYLQAKDDFEMFKAVSYKKHRSNGMNTLDATNEAKFESIPSSRNMHDLRCKTDKTKALVDDVTDVIINMSISLREMNIELKHE